jgi:hypothetical protein
MFRLVSSNIFKKKKVVAGTRNVPTISRVELRNFLSNNVVQQLSAGCCGHFAKVEPAIDFSGDAGI